MNTLYYILLILLLMAFIGIIIFNRIIKQRIQRASERCNNTKNMMQQAMNVCENAVLYYDISKKKIWNLYGHLLPEEGVSTEEWKEHVHPEDLPDALYWLHLLMEGKGKSAEFRFHWNFEYGGGRPRWGYLHNISVAEYEEGQELPVGIINTMIDETEIKKQQDREKELTEKYKLVFEQSIIGLSFYTPDGKFLDANQHMRKLCNFDTREGYEFFTNVNLFEASPFRDHVNKEHIEEFWVCAKGDIPGQNSIPYLEIRLLPIYDKDGKLAYISIATRDVSEERDMYLQSKLNDIQIQKANEEIHRYETELQYMMEAIDMRAWRINYAERKVQFMKGLSKIEKELSFEEYESYFIDDHDEIKKKFTDPEKYFKEPISVLRKMRPVFHSTDEIQWNQINSLPIYDDKGKLVAAFGIIRNMTKFIQVQEQLKQETQRANESGQLKSVFLANMTHEIRTPLNAIVGFSDLIQMMTTLEDKRELIHVIHNNCDMLLRLINDIMAISAMDSNGLIMTPTDTDFAVAFNEMCQSLAQRVENPKVEFIKENPYHTLLTHLDAGRITQVITNFVTNAVKYTQEGHIRVGYRLQDNGIYMYCEDTGVGIPKEQCSNVFDRFVKLNDYVQGTGLGLSICKAIAEHCNGKIGVDSEVGKGSTFWFWIPVEIKEVN